MLLTVVQIFRQQMLINKIKRIDGLFFTHEHAITAGFDIRPFFFRQVKFLYMLKKFFNHRKEI